MDPISILQKQVAELTKQLVELQATELPMPPTKKQRTQQPTVVLDKTFTDLYLYEKKQKCGTTTYSWTRCRTDHYRSSKVRVCNCQGGRLGGG